MAIPKKIYGLIGYPVKHSLSALMHNAAFAALGISAEYRLFEIEPSKLEGFLLGNIEVRDTQGEEFDSKDIIGFNITIPYKVRALEILKKIYRLPIEKLSREDSHYIKLSGAINTVDRQNSFYYNTDVPGFLRALQEKKVNGGLEFVSGGKSALVIGSGGAGRAVIAALCWESVDIKKIYVTDIDKNTLNSVSDAISDRLTGQRLVFIAPEEVAEVIAKCALLVNASPVGMKDGDVSPINKEWLHKDLYVYDVVYNRETQLIRDAKEAECHFADGLGMLLYQGAAAFELWTGKPAPIEVMRKALEEGVNKL